MNYLNFLTNEIISREEAAKLAGGEKILQEYEKTARQVWKDDPFDIAQFSCGLEIGQGRSK